MTENPFFIKEGFLSPLKTEYLTNVLNIRSSASKISLNRINNELNLVIESRLSEIISDIEEFFSKKLPLKHSIHFQSLTPNSPKCSTSWDTNSDYTIVIFLSEENREIPFDIKYECIGGNLRFWNHNIIFNAERGKMIMFPSSKYFPYNITPVTFNTSHFITINI